MTHPYPLDIQQELAQAINTRRLAAYCRGILELEDGQADSERTRAAQDGLDACQATGEYCIRQNREMIALLKSKGVGTKNDKSGNEPRLMQIYSFDLEVESDDLDQAMAVFAEQGYLHWSPDTGGAWQAFKRLNHRMELITTDTVTTRLNVSWRQPLATTKLSRIFRPRTADMQRVHLPDALWPLYYLVRPFRVLADAVRGRRRPVLGPFLGTPISLIEPLLNFANVTEDDVLFDLGCGDGRIVSEAARLRGCRAVGIEQKEDLIEIGRTRVVTDGLSDLVQLICGNASTTSLDEATVVFLFLPTTVIRELLPGIRRQLKPGARIVAHEQRPMDTGIAPNQSRPIITSSSVTVAHLWEVT